MKQLWSIRAEIEVEPGDLDLEEGYTRGFMNVVTWASTKPEATKKLAEYLSNFRWFLLGIQDAVPADALSSRGDELEDMLERAQHDREAILLGTFNAYRS